MTAFGNTVEFYSRELDIEVRFQFPKHLLLLGETWPESWTLSSGVGLEPGMFLLLTAGSKKRRLFTIAKTWKQPKCPTTEEWIKNIHTYIHTYIHTMEY